MNYSNSSSSFNRGFKHPMLQQSYSPYAPIPSNNHMSQMMPLSTMSQFSQQYPPDVTNSRYPYEQNPIRPGTNGVNQPTYNNIQNKQANFGSNMQQVNQNTHNCEQIDIQTLISPVFLKAYNVLRECEVNPELLDKIQLNLSEKLKNMKEYHKKFKNNMEQIIQKAQMKLRQAQKAIKVNKKNGKSHKQKNRNMDSGKKRMHSIQNPTKKQRTQNRNQQYERTLSLQNYSRKNI